MFEAVSMLFWNRKKPKLEIPAASGSSFGPERGALPKTDYPFIYNRDVIASGDNHTQGWGLRYSPFNSNDLPSESCFIYRFVSLTALAQMLAKGFSFTRTDFFLDPRDSMIPQQVGKKSIYSDKEWLVIRRAFAASCWKIMKYICNDDFAIINRNGGEPRQCAISLTIEDFVAKMSWDGYELLRGPMLYVDEGRFNLISGGTLERNSFFWKTPQYAYEQEYRFLIESGSWLSSLKDKKALERFTYLPFDWRGVSIHPSDDLGTPEREKFENIVRRSGASVMGSPSEYGRG